MTETKQTRLFHAPLNRKRWYIRWPLKWALFGLAYVAVCFPYPNLLIRHIAHWSNPNALIQPKSPSLQPLATKLRAGLPPGLSPKDTLRHVEKFVYDHVKYKWDWDTWGMADYLPTVEEVFQVEGEDCDGRAVVAASLLKNLGYDARIVTDFAHVWVTTPEGETMGPGKTKTVEVTEKGMKFDSSGLKQIPQTLAYGIAVFPWPRELILLGVFWVLLLGRPGVVGPMLAVVFLTVGLFLVRYGGVNYRSPAYAYEWLGLAAFVMGIVILCVPAPGRRDRKKTLESGSTPATAGEPV